MKVGHELLVWRDELATGINQIDRQHKLLITILNDANTSFRTQTDIPIRLKVLEDLVGYTIYHFDFEEELIESSGYGNGLPDDEKAHVFEHRRFAKTVGEYLLALEQGESIDHESLFAFLNNWLLNHVMGTDQKFAAYYRTQEWS